MQLSDFRNEPFTDFSQPENQQAFEAALQKVQQGYLGRTWSCWINGDEVKGAATFDGHDPGDLSRHIGTYQELGAAEANLAVEKAHEAFPEWSRTDVRYRVDLFMKAAQRLRERKHEFSAMLCYEVGKSWAEADGDTARPHNGTARARNCKAWHGEYFPFGDLMCSPPSMWSPKLIQLVRQSF